MRILLTGRTGQVGGALLPQLAAHDVIAPTRAEFDLRHAAELASFVARVRPELIVNCAADTAVDDAENNVARADAVNATAPGALAVAAAAVGAGMLHFSTDYVFDGTATAPYRETDACAPINAYGRSKRAGELAVQASGAAHLIVRTSWVYAASGRNFLRTMLHLFAEREVVNVVADQIGAPTPATQIGAMIAAIVGRMEAGAAAHLSRQGGILNMACRGQTSWHGFALAILDEARRRGWKLKIRELRPIASADYPTRAPRPRFSVFDLGRLEREFGLAPPDWRAALAELMDRLPAPPTEA
ncbi:MAG: dTDP-4-dehydrorhamnose reductase [Alphaproteobacteria bacterium]